MTCSEAEASHGAPGSVFSFLTLSWELTWISSPFHFDWSLLNCCCGLTTLWWQTFSNAQICPSLLAKSLLLLFSSNLPGLTHTFQFQPLSCILTCSFPLPVQHFTRMLHHHLPRPLSEDTTSLPSLLSNLTILGNYTISPDKCPIDWLMHWLLRALFTS